jgi:Calx-beta domain
MMRRARLLAFLSTMSLAAIASASSVTYTYDELGRLKFTTFDSGSGTIYTLDAAGNRKTVAQGLASALQLAPATYSVNDSAGNVTLTVTRTNGTFGPTQVSYATANGTAVAGTNYVSTSGILSWANGDAASKTITVPVTNTHIYGPNKTFTVTLSSVSNATLGVATATVTIVDTNPTVLPTTPLNLRTTTLLVNQVVLAWNASTDPVGGPGLKNYLVFRNGSLLNPAVLSLNPTYTDNSVVAGSAYTYTVEATDILNTPSAMSAGLPVTIPTTYQITDASGNVIPAAAALYSTSTTCANFNICVWMLVTKYGTPTTVFSIYNTVPTPGCPSGTTLGTTAGYARPDGTTDCLITAIPSSYGQTPVPPQASTLSFSSSTYSALEANTGVTVTVTRTNGINGSASVQYATSNGTAAAPGQYTATSGTLTWAAGDPSTKTFTVPIFADGIWNTSETVNLLLSNPTGTTTPVLGTSSALISIQNTEAGALQFSQGNYTVNETAGTISVPVARSNGGYQAASVSYATTNGSALAGADYTGVSGTLSWADGDTATQVITIPITNSGVFGPNKTFTINLSGAAGAALSTPSATVTIVDNNPVVPPSTPSGLTAGTVSVSQIAFSWNFSTDAGGPGIGSYQIFRNSVQIGTVGPSTNSYNDTTITPGAGVTYSYDVVAVDTLLTPSAHSAALPITPPQTYQITDASGNVIAAAASLYSSSFTCSALLMSCKLTITTRYATPTAVYSFFDHNSANPCPDATGAVFNVSAVAGYTQPSTTSCIIMAAPSVYGH